MKRFERMTYTEQIRLRTRALWWLVAAMLVYMVIVGETGGDSRMMTPLAEAVSRILFFGGLVFIGCRIAHNKKLLKSRARLKEQMEAERDERSRYLHDKSGGVVMDAMLVCLLFATLTASLFNMAAFYTAGGLLAAAVCLKAGAYWVFSRR